MNANSHNSKLFNESGCLSRETLSRYVNSMLMDDELKLVETHITSCPLCKDAVEGSKLINKDAVGLEDMTEKLNMRLRQRFNYLPGNKKAATRGPRLRSFIITAAASIIILISIISYFHFLVPDNNELALLDKTEAVDTERKEATTIGGVFNNDTDEKSAPAASQDKKGAEPPQKDVVVSIKEEEAAEAIEVSVAKEEIMNTELDEDIPKAEQIPEDETITAYSMEEVSGGGNDLEDAAVVSRAKAGKKAYSETNEMIVVYDQDPSFPGGDDSLYSFLDTFMKYAVATEQYADTSIIVQFIVSRKGFVKDLIIVKGAGEEINDEVLRVLKVMPDWIPAIKQGKNVRDTVTLPIFLNFDE